MLFDELVAKVGAERYREACERARATAAGTGRCGGQRSWAGDLQAVPPQFGDAWWHGEASLRERLETALRLYADMPCYPNTVALHNFYGEFGDDERRMLWDAYRAWLSHGSATSSSSSPTLSSAFDAFGDLGPGRRRAAPAPRPARRHARPPGAARPSRTDLIGLPRPQPAARSS